MAAIIYTTTLKILDRLPSLSLALAPARLGASLPYFSNSVDRAHLDDMVVRESKVSRRGGLAEAEILAALCISLKLIYGIGSEEVCVPTPTISFPLVIPFHLLDLSKEPVFCDDTDSKRMMMGTHSWIISLRSTNG